MECLVGNTREAHRRRMVLDLDLNLLPPNENNSLDGISTGASPQEMPAVEHGQSQPQFIMDVEDIDDEVAIISPRTFVEARNKSRRNQEGTNVHDEVTIVNNSYSATEFPRWLPLTCNMHKTSPQSWDLNINPEVSKKTKRKSASVPPEWSLSVPPSEPSTFSCPFCIGKLIEETSTKCGHIFCKECIQAAIAAQNKCPTCRQSYYERHYQDLPSSHQLNEAFTPTRRKIM